MSALPESRAAKAPAKKKKTLRGITLSPTALVLLVLINAAVLGLILWGAPRLGSRFAAPSGDASPTESVTPPTSSPTSPVGAGDIPLTVTLPPYYAPVPALDGLMVLSLTEAGYAHLFAYVPRSLPFTRLTFGDWDDVQPALSPDGTRVAFASHRQGRWDIYVLDLTDGKTLQVTDSLAYDGRPSWSPDGQWLAYESYADNNLDIYMSPLDGSIEPVRLTFYGGADYAPAWSPAGRLVAYTSNQNGNEDIWLANLDVVGDSRFTNLTKDPTANQSHPAWSPDGAQLAWVAAQGGTRSVYIQDRPGVGSKPVYIGSGEYPIWDAGGTHMLIPLLVPDSYSLTAYDLETGALALPPLALPGELHGGDWGLNGLPAELPATLQAIANRKVEASWEAGDQTAAPATTTGTVTSFGRQQTVDLENVIAPHPSLNALAVEPFKALRKRVASDTGWDVLAVLENAFLPITEPLPQGMERDWLFTGRAFTLSPVLIDIGWMAVVKEEYGAQTFWRVYLRAERQDGSLGQPLTQLPWDFDARFSGDPLAYEQGGKLAASVPAGYWIDFTALAQAYGWVRLPALSNWRSFLTAALFNEFAYTAGLYWETAMLQLYPPDALATPQP